MMNKSILAAAITMALSSAAHAAVTSITITSMDFGNNYAATGTLNNSSPYGSMTSVDLFYGIHWTAHANSFFSITGVTQSYAGTAGSGSYNYQFTLSAGQIAWGTAFSWNASNENPVLVIMTCGANVGDACTGVGTPMQTPPFAGSAPAFNGTVASVSVVPLPATAWLMGSGLIGLVGVARRHKAA